MPRSKAAVPSLRYHVSGQSIVQIDGATFYLGKHGSPESFARYAVLVREYQANGQTLPDGFTSQTLKSLTTGFEIPKAPMRLSDAPILVKHITASYRDHANKVYAGSTAERHRINQVCRDIEQADGGMVASEYGPKALSRQRQRWVDSGKSRTYCNRLTCYAVRMFKWAVAEELVSEAVLVRLSALEPLRFGQTEAPEREKRQPVPLALVRRTVPELSPILRDMVRVQVATGMRPTELCTMRPCDIDRSGPEWIYRPEHHKNKSKGKSRSIPIMGDAREVVENYLNRDPKAYLFSPSESVAWWQAKKRSERKSKVQPSQASRAKADPEIQPGERYTQDSYRRAIARACKRAEVPVWYPYQLRHLALTEIREAIGVEHAQAMGGHSRIDMTEHYAKVSERKAIEAARHAPSLGADAS